MAVSASHSILIHSAGRDTPDINTAFLRHPGIRLSTSSGAGDVVADVRRDIPDLVIEVLRDEAPAAAPLCAELKADARTRSIPVILVTPVGQRQVADGAHPDAVLLKPVVVRELFDAVCKYVPLPTRRGLRYEVNLRFAFEYGGRTMQAFSRDLSLSGAFIKTDRVILEGVHLSLTFTIPGDDREIACGGVVRQALSFGSCSRHSRGVGIEFEGISDDDLARLEAYIVSHSRRRRFR